ncbi:PaaI family thioesterase [Acidomonas methanolica]|uniref:PaaI family thioesterase n=1 Tax=Acidomonas methanolica TaxID=437 RepID=UPI00211A3BFB|nr:PaaI family thioesterase [Acidomonas methanolica]MCQ9154228.1 PaaI family thioesterase [Acidomonas methanolica]
MTSTEAGNGSCARPPGFRALPLPKGLGVGEPGFHEATGGFDVAARDGKLLAGFVVEPKHCNHVGVCHGGMIATVFDGYLAMAAMFANHLQVPIMPTMSLTVDFLAPGLLGKWIGFSADVLRVTRTVAFVQGLAMVDGEPIARASGLYRRLTADPDGPDTGQLLRAFLQADD